MHLAIDTATSDIRIVEFTPGSGGLPELLGKIPKGEKIGTVTADRAYCSRRCPSDYPDPQERAAVQRGLPGCNTTLRATRHYGRPL